MIHGLVYRSNDQPPVWQWSKYRYSGGLQDGRDIELNEVLPMKSELHRMSGGPIILVGEHLHPLLVDQLPVFEVFQLYNDLHDVVDALT